MLKYIILLSYYNSLREPQTKKYSSMYIIVLQSLLLSVLVCVSVIRGYFLSLWVLPNILSYNAMRATSDVTTSYKI